MAKADEGAWTAPGCQDAKPFIELGNGLPAVDQLYAQRPPYCQAFSGALKHEWSGRFCFFQRHMLEEVGEYLRSFDMQLTLDYDVLWEAVVENDWEYLSYRLADTLATKIGLALLDRPGVFRESVPDERAAPCNVTILDGVGIRIVKKRFLNRIRVCCVLASGVHETTLWMPDHAYCDLIAKLGVDNAGIVGPHLLAGLTFAHAFGSQHPIQFDANPDANVITTDHYLANETRREAVLRKRREIAIHF